MTLLYENNAAGTLADPITNSQLTITLNAGQAVLFPNPAPPDEFYATLTDAATQTNVEIVLVTQVSGNVLTIAPGGRGQDGTTAQSWLAGDIISQRTIAAELRQWQGIVPIGGIIMWSGAATAIPENWALCNGSSGTPNLEGQFVIGAGGAFAVGATGGSANALLNHTHELTDPTHVHGIFDPSHVHGAPSGFDFLTSQPSAGNFGGGASPLSEVAETAPAVTGIVIEPAATGIVIDGVNTGGSIPVTPTANSLPPYYALCFIMRTS